MVSCLAAEAVEDRIVTQCEITNNGFSETGQNQKVRIKISESGRVYYSLEDLQNITGCEYSTAESECIYNNIQKCGSPCVALTYNGEKYELFTRFFHLVSEGGASVAHNYTCSALYSQNDKDVFVSQDALITILSGYMVVTTDGNIYILKDNGKVFPGTHGLTKSRRKAVQDAMFLLYAKSRSDYETIMRFEPSFCAVSQDNALDVCKRKAGAYVNFDSPVIHIVYDSFGAKTDSFAALLLHEATHWVVGYQGLSTETIPSEHEIRCLINLGTELNRIQARIDQYMGIAEYKNGGRLGQKLLDVELQHQKGEQIAHELFLPVNNITYVPLGKFLLDKGESE